MIRRARSSTCSTTTPPIPQVHGCSRPAAAPASQTVTLVRNSPDATFTSIDVSESQLEQARERVPGVDFQRADIFSLPFEPQSFDHVFVCFTLEHLTRPLEALRKLMKVLRPGGTMTVIEGDHGSAYFHPDSDAAREAIACLVKLQHGDANIGRCLFPLLTEAGLHEVQVSPRLVYADASRPGLVESFTRRTFTAMIEGVREGAIDSGLIDSERFDQGDRRPLSLRRGRRHLLLHVLQGDSPSLSFRSSAISVACSSGDSDAIRLRSFSRCSGVSSSISALPFAVSSISVPRRSFGSGERATSPAVSRRSSRFVVPLEPIIIAVVRSLTRS